MNLQQPERKSKNPQRKLLWEGEEEALGQELEEEEVLGQVLADSTCGNGF